MIRVTSFGLTKSDQRDIYIARLKRMIPFEWKEIALRRCPDKRSAQLLPEEKKFLDAVPRFTMVDMTGREMNSREFFHFCFSASGGHFAERHFVIGPAIGFHWSFRDQAESTLSLSRLTLTHGLAQVILAESLYRVACELKNHPFVK